MNRGLLARRVVLGMCGLLLLAIVLGCMGVSIAEHHDTFRSEDGTDSQRGRTTVPSHQELDVYYPAPFASPPNLTVESNFDECLVVTQQADHFRIKNPSPFSREVTWQARGVRVIPSATVILPAPVSNDE